MLKKLLIGAVLGTIALTSVGTSLASYTSFTSEIDDDSDISDDITNLGLDTDNYYNYDDSDYSMVSVIATGEGYDVNYDDDNNVESVDINLYVYFYNPYQLVEDVSYIDLAYYELTSSEYSASDFDLDSLDFEYEFYSCDLISTDSDLMISKYKIETDVTYDIDDTNYRAWSVDKYKYLSGISGSNGATTAGLSLDGLNYSYTSVTLANTFNTVVKDDGSEVDYNYNSYIILTSIGVYSFCYDDSDTYNFWDSLFGDADTISNGQWFFCNFSTDTSIDDIISLSCIYTLREYDYSASYILDSDLDTDYFLTDLTSFANAEFSDSDYYDACNDAGASLSYDTDNDITYTYDDPNTVFAYDDDGNRAVTTYGDDDYTLSFDNICMSASDMLSEEEAEEFGIDYDSFLYDDDGDEYDYSVCFDCEPYTYTSTAISDGYSYVDSISGSKYSIENDFRVISLEYEYDGVIYNAIVNSGADQGDTDITVPQSTVSYTFWETFIAFFKICLTAVTTLVAGTFSITTIGSSLWSWFTGYLYYSIVVSVLVLLIIAMLPSLFFYGVRLLIFLFKEICKLFIDIIKIVLQGFKFIFSFMFISKE